MRHRLRSIVDHLIFIYGGLLRWAGGLVLFLAGFLATGWAATGLAVISVVGILLGLHQLHRQATRYEVWDLDAVPRLDAHEATESVVWAPVRARIGTAGRPSASHGTQVWEDLAVNEALCRQSRTGYGVAQAVVELARHPFVLPEDLRVRAPAAVKAQSKAAGGRHPQLSVFRAPIRFNGRLMRLELEPTVRALEAGAFRAREVRYFDAEASNEVWSMSVTSAEQRDRAPAPEHPSPVQRHVWDSHGRILPLETAQAANIVGISIVALTPRRDVLVIRQTRHNSIAGGGIGASGSGSLDYADFRKAQARLSRQVPRRAGRLRSEDETGTDGDGRVDGIPLVELLLEGMVRELCEESGLRHGEVRWETAAVTGYFRWADRAMKPEFTGVVEVTAEAEDLERRRLSRGERVFSSHVIPVSLQSLVDAAARDGADSKAPPGGDSRQAVAEKVTGALSAAVLAHESLGRDEPVVISPSTVMAVLNAVEHWRWHAGVTRSEENMLDRESGHDDSGA